MDANHPYKKIMHPLPNMSRRENSPKRKAEKKKLLPTLLSSAAAILIIMFALGQFPQVDSFFASLNEATREHNDEIVRLLIRSAPAIVFVLGALGLSYMAVSSIRARRRSA